RRASRGAPPPVAAGGGPGFAGGGDLGRSPPAADLAATGCGFGTFSAATLGCDGAPPGAATSVWCRCTATCCTVCACFFASVRATGSRWTVFTPLALASCDAGTSTWLLFTVVWLTLVTLVTFVTFVTLVTFFWTMFCCTSVRGGHGARPSWRATQMSTWMLAQRGSSRCS